MGLFRDNRETKYKFSISIILKKYSSIVRDYHHCPIGLTLNYVIT